jgi:hypothetical protein
MSSLPRVNMQDVGGWLSRTASTIKGSQQARAVTGAAGAVAARLRGVLARAGAE